MNTEDRNKPLLNPTNCTVCGHSRSDHDYQEYYSEGFVRFKEPCLVTNCNCKYFHIEG